MKTKLTLIFIILTINSISLFSQKWELVYRLLPESDTTIYTFAINSHEDIYAFLTFRDTVLDDVTRNFFKTTDKGKSWEKILDEFQINNLNPLEAVDFFRTIRNVSYKMEIDYEDNIYIPLIDTLYRSTDNGSSFKVVLDLNIVKEIFKIQGDNLKIFALETSPQNNLYVSVFVHDTTNTNEEIFFILKTNDRGNTWLPLTAYRIYFSRIAFNSEGDIFAAREFSVHRSKDDGKTWKDITYYPPDFSCGWPVNITVHTNGDLFVIDEAGSILKSTNIGETWELIFKDQNYNCSFFCPLEVSKEGIIITKYRFITESGKILKEYNYGFRNFYKNRKNSIFAYTWREIYKLDETTDVEDSENNNPNTISPNPFTNSTTINYSVDTPVYVKLTIYNALGIEVALLVNEMISTGRHSAVFNAEGFASGMYFFILKIDDEIFKGKLYQIK